MVSNKSIFLERCARFSAATAGGRRQGACQRLRSEQPVGVGVCLDGGDCRRGKQDYAGGAGWL